MKKNGFTTSEVLITLGILGVIAAFMMPALIHVMPDKNDENHKKANYQIEQIISQMYSDDTMYPKISAFNKSGFKNTDMVLIEGTTYSGDTKFCQLFAKQFKKISSGVNCGSTDSPDTISFKTPDGMNWYIPKTTFSKGWTTIKVDINGDEIRKGNKTNACEYNASTCKKPDLFTYFVRSNGTVIASTDDDKKPNDPAIDSASPYSVSIEIICNSDDTNCGSVTLKDSEGTERGTVNGNGGTVTGLPTDTYTLTADAATDYYSNYSSSARKVVIDGKNLNTNVRVIFVPIDKHCIYVNVNDCDSSNLTSCAAYTLKKYLFGLGGLRSLSGTEMTMTQDSSNGTNYYRMKYCGLPIGDYQLTVTPKSGYFIIPVPHDAEGNRISSYYQNIKLGTEDVNINVTFTDQEPPDVIAGHPNFDPDNNVYGDDDDDEDIEYITDTLAGVFQDCSSPGKTECGSINSGLSADYWAEGNYLCMTYTTPARNLLPSSTDLQKVLKYVAKKGSAADKSALLDQWIYSRDEISSTLVRTVKYNTADGSVETGTESKGSASCQQIICLP